MTIHETHRCRDCDAEITLPYVDRLAAAIDAVPGSFDEYTPQRFAAAILDALAADEAGHYAGPERRVHLPRRATDKWPGFTSNTGSSLPGDRRRTG